MKRRSFLAALAAVAAAPAALAHLGRKPVAPKPAPANPLPWPVGSLGWIDQVEKALNRGLPPGYRVRLERILDGGLLAGGVYAGLRYRRFLASLGTFQQWGTAPRNAQVMILRQLKYQVAKSIHDIQAAG